MLWYFGYGSNMALRSLRAKGIAPRLSERAVLRGWRLRFNVRHFFRHEGGMANLEPANDPCAKVWGVLHQCEEGDLALLDAAEAYPHGYDRITVSVVTDRSARAAVTYIGTPAFRDESCRPTRRYLSLLLEGAAAAGLDPAYIEWLRRHRVQPQPPAAPEFVPPPGDYPTFTAALLAQHPLLTALDGAVFDMSAARWHHRFLWNVLGGKDTTLFHLRRLESSDGRETLDDVRYGRLTAAQRRCLDEYLQAYAAEYVYCGRFRYD